MTLVCPPPSAVLLFEDMAGWVVLVIESCCMLPTDDEWFLLDAFLRLFMADWQPPLELFVLSASEFLRLFNVVYEMGIFGAVGIGPNPVILFLMGIWDEKASCILWIDYDLNKSLVGTWCDVCLWFVKVAAAVGFITLLFDTRYLSICAGPTWFYYPSAIFPVVFVLALWWLRWP